MAITLPGFENYCTVEQAAEALGVTKASIEAWASRGLVKKLKAPNGSVFLAKADLTPENLLRPAAAIKRAPRTAEAIAKQKASLAAKKGKK